MVKFGGEKRFETEPQFYVAIYDLGILDGHQVKKSPLPFRREKLRFFYRYPGNDLIVFCDQKPASLEGDFIVGGDFQHECPRTLPYAESYIHRRWGVLSGYLLTLA